jgi:hypothetical protein
LVLPPELAGIGALVVHLAGLCGIQVRLWTGSTVDGVRPVDLLGVDSLLVGDWTPLGVDADATHINAPLADVEAMTEGALPVVRLGSLCRATAHPVETLLYLFSVVERAANQFAAQPHDATQASYASVLHQACATYAKATAGLLPEAPLAENRAKQLAMQLESHIDYN